MEVYSRITGKVMKKFECCDLSFLFVNTVNAHASVLYFQEYYLRKIHNLVTDFIEHMPLKVC